MELLGFIGVIHKEQLNREMQVLEIKRKKIYHLIAFLLESSEERYGWFLAYLLILPTLNLCLFLV